MGMDMDMEMNKDMDMDKNMDMDMDMGGMASHFNIRTSVTVLFKPFKVESAAGMGVACVIFVFLAILYEGLRCLRVNLAERQGWKKQTDTCFTKAHTVQTLLYITELIFGYFLMLVAMTYNYWLFLAVVCGAAIGLQLCTIFSNVHNPGLIQHQEEPYTTQKGSSSCHGAQSTVEETKKLSDTDEETETGQGGEQSVKKTVYKTTSDPCEVVELVTSTV